MKEILIHSWTNWMNSYDFEALVTVRLPPNLPIQSAHELYINDVIRPMGKHLKTRIGCVTAIVPTSDLHRAHIHSLVLSHHSNIASSTNELQTYLRSLTTTLNNHEKAIDITLIKDSDVVAEYFANHMSDEVEFRHYCPYLVAKRTTASNGTGLF